MVLGNNPPLNSYAASESHHTARCAQIEPIPDTPQSPPAHENGQQATFADDLWYRCQPHYEPERPHITGVAVTGSGICGNPNLVSRGDCIICGKSFATIKEELTFDYLERNHQAENLMQNA